MANYIENLKNSLVNYCIKREKKGQPENISKRIERETADPEESSLLMDENDRNKVKFAMQGITEESYNSISFLPTNKIPIVYGLLGVITVVFMLGLAYFKDLNNKKVKGLYSELGPMKVQFISLFNLPKVNYFIFHLINSTTAITGIGLVCAVYMVVTMKFRQNKYDYFQYLKLYVTVIYGLISNFSQMVYGAVFFMDGFEAYNKLLTKEAHLSIYEFLFSLQIFFTILFGIFMSCILYSMKSKPSYSIDEETHTADNEREFRWLNYKMLVLVYLLFFSLAHIVVTLHSNKVILVNFDSVLFKSNYSYLLAFMPYALYFLNIGLYVMFYEELRSSHISIYQPSERIIYDHNKKNIL